jgi:hypothetical protein
MLTAAFVVGALGAVGRLPAADRTLAGARPAPVAKAPAVKTPAAKAEEPVEAVDVLGANAACCVCHMTFVAEDLVKTHLKEKVGCIDCHGLSAKHANDENIGATKPDVVFKRPQVDGNCVKCHEGHNVAAKAVIARLNERHLSATTAPICTDCHGTHKIDRSAAINP